MTKRLVLAGTLAFLGSAVMVQRADARDAKPSKSKVTCATMRCAAGHRCEDTPTGGVCKKGCAKNEKLECPPCARPRPDETPESVRARCQCRCVAVADGAGAACGSRGMAPCAKGLFCQRPPTANCGRADLPGKCAVRPQFCTKEYRPVCGCDGRTYGNACDAAAAGVSVDYLGQCRKASPSKAKGADSR